MTKSRTRIAKMLRKNQTEAEKQLWLHLRNKQLGGFKFRRQQPIGPYIVDFVCFDVNFIIEVDGGQHSVNRHTDMQRDGWFRAEGYDVLRFWNSDVLHNIDGVLSLIRKKLANTIVSR